MTDWGMYVWINFSINSDNGSALVRRQAILWTNIDSNRILGDNFQWKLNQNTKLLYKKLS